jgi:predicted transcriptional regulator
MDGKNAIEAENIADVITSLQVIRSAVDAGELDKRIEAVTGKIKEGMREATPTPVQTPAAPEKRSILGLSSRKS